MGAKMITPMIAFVSSLMWFSSLKKDPEPVTLRVTTYASQRCQTLRFVVDNRYHVAVAYLAVRQARRLACQTPPSRVEKLELVPVEGHGDFRARGAGCAQLYQCYHLHVTLQFGKRPGACHAPGLVSSCESVELPAIRFWPTVLRLSPC